MYISVVQASGIDEYICSKCHGASSPQMRVEGTPGRGSTADATAKPSSSDEKGTISPPVSAPTAADYKGLKVIQLKTLLKANGLSAVGKKSALVSRLQEHKIAPLSSKKPSDENLIAKPDPSLAISEEQAMAVQWILCLYEGMRTSIA